MTDVETAKLLLDVIPNVNRAIRTEIRAVAKAEFTIPQYRLLLHVSREPGSNGELADWMGVRAPTMSRMIDALVQRDLLRRDSPPDGADRRLVRVKVTKTGMACAKRIRASVLKTAMAWMEGFSATEKRELVAGLSVLRRRFTTGQDAARYDKSRRAEPATLIRTRKK